MIIRIPEQTKKFLQSNKTKFYGPFANLWATMNIDLFTVKGIIKLANRLKIVSKTGDTGASNLGVPVGFTYFNSAVFCIGGARIFTSSSDIIPNTTFTEDASTGAITTYSADRDDLANFNGTLVASESTHLYSLNQASGGTWTSRTSALSSNERHMLAYFKKYNRLYVTNNSSVNSIDTGWTFSNTAGSFSITLNQDSGGVISCMEAGSDRLWIGMRRGVAGSGDTLNPLTGCSVLEWDGSGAQILKEHRIPASGVLAMVIRDDKPIIMDTNGVLREFSGFGFKEIGRLPLERGQSLRYTGISTACFIHPKGLTISKDGTILALINGSCLNNLATTETPVENLPSGIWEFDGEGGANHRHSFSYMPITSTTVTDHGQNRVVSIGSISNMKIASNSTYGIETLMAGCEYYTNATSSTMGVFIDAPTSITNSTYTEGQKYGYFVTPWVQGFDALEMWQKAFIKYRQLLTSGDKIVVKYRLTEGIPVKITATWASTTTFTTTTNITSYVGYEVEVLNGTGGGKCAHITSVATSAGPTYTATLDETFTGVTSGTAIVRIQNWTRIGDVTDQLSEMRQITVAKNSPRIQVKVCLQFTGDDEFHELDILSSVQQPIA